MFIIIEHKKMFMTFTKMKGDVCNMQWDYMSFEYGRKDGTIQSKDDFYSEHSISLTSVQKERLEQNLEVRCTLILKEFVDKEIVVSGFYQTFIFKDIQTDELYLKPLEHINIKVYFKQMTPILLIYDIRDD